MNEIKVYGSTTCPICKMLKKYLTQKGISFIEKNVDQDEAAKDDLIKMNILSIPVTVKGNTVIKGFDKVRIDKELIQDA